MDAVDLGAENDGRMAKLREALTLGNGFQLVIVQVEPGEQREEVLRRLSGWSGRHGVPRLELVRLAPEESAVMRLAEEHPGVILVGLEAEPDDERERSREMIAELNWSRDRLPELVRGPLVLVVSQRIQNALFEHAPDFYSWRAHSTSIVRWPLTPQPFASSRGLWFGHEVEDPTVLEAAIADGSSQRPLPAREIARLYTRLAAVRAARQDYPEADAALDAAYERYVQAGTADDRVKVLLLRFIVAVRKSRFDEAASWLAHARREAALGTQDARLASHLLSASAVLASERDDDAAMAELQHAISTSQALGDRDAEAMLVSTEAILTLRRGDPLASIAPLERALELYRRAGNPVAEATTLMMLASAAADAGRSDDAERYGIASVVRAEASGEVDVVARARGMLGLIAIDNNSLELADETLRHDVVAQTPDASGGFAAARAQLALHHGDLAMAERYLREALNTFQRHGGMTSQVAMVSLQLGKLGRRTKNWTLAATGFDTADRLGDRAQRAVAALGLAELAFDQGERTFALADQLAYATRMLIDIGDATLADTAREHRGAVLLVLGRDVEAREELEVARSGFETRGQAESAARVQDLLAQLERRGEIT